MGGQTTCRQTSASDSTCSTGVKAWQSLWHRSTVERGWRYKRNTSAHENKHRQPAGSAHDQGTIMELHLALLPKL